MIGVPKGIRTPVTAVKGQCPRPLDDGDPENGGARRDRTADLLHAMQALSQLSYSPKTKKLMNTKNAKKRTAGQNPAVQFLSLQRESKSLLLHVRVTLLRPTVRAVNHSTASATNHVEPAIDLGVTRCRGDVDRDVQTLRSTCPVASIECRRK
jgi:hypothetical protein